MNILQHLLLPFYEPALLIWIALGTFFGLYVGAIPGLSVTMAVSLLISFTFSWDVSPAVAVMVGIYCGGVYGGSRSAILLNIPGAPSAIATTFDGYPLAQKGEASRAIGITVVQSVLGGLIGVIVLAVGAPIVAGFALMFSPTDYFLLGLMGLMLVSSLGGESTCRGIFIAALGLLIGTVGMDSLTGTGRYTFGSNALLSGINYVPVMIGLFGMSEALLQLRDLRMASVRQKIDKITPDFKSIVKYLPLSARTSILGVFVGALPGTGGDLAALMAYDHAKRSVKNPQTPFGEGAVEGLVAPESANNAAIGGAFIPMLTLGIPGDAVTAVIIGALNIHNLKPGPLLIAESPEIFWLIISALFLANIFLLFFGFSGIKVFAKIVEIKKSILMPVIIVLSVVGAYSINNNLTDIYWMLGFGVLGYILKLYKFPVGPLILGVILSPLLERNFRRAMIESDESLRNFFFNITQQPISLVIALAIAYMIISQSLVGVKLKEALGKIKPGIKK